MARLYIIYIFL
uniref:Uncharacterized protein n=1 Tax=Moniliophthora roreri TaxID=221103 RepID=A0A0W0G2E6_MONRR